MSVVYSRPTHPAPGSPSAPARTPAYAPLPVGVTPANKTRISAGLFGGFIGGAVLGAVFFLIGLVLTWTIIGAIVGIPLMIAAFTGPIVGIFTKAEMLNGACPYCGTAVETGAKSLGFNCPACKERILVGPDTFRRKNVILP